MSMTRETTHETTRRLGWDDGRWTNEPVSVRITPGGDGSRDHLVVEPASGSDLWRTTSYGFVHDDAPGLLTDLPDGAAMEVDFVLGGSEQFDQAGILVRADAEYWIKAGVEFADGSLQLGAVVTAGVSDWSAGQVSSWVGRRIGVRVSRSGDALTVRARVEDEPWPARAPRPDRPGGAVAGRAVLLRADPGRSGGRVPRLADRRRRQRAALSASVTPSAHSKGAYLPPLNERNRQRAHARAARDPTRRDQLRMSLRRNHQYAAAIVMTP